MTTSRNRLIAIGIAAVAAVAMIIGSIGPWVEATVIFVSFSVNGTVGSGMLSIGAAVGAATGLGLALRCRWWAIGSIPCFGGGSAIAIYTIAEISKLQGDYEYGLITTGWGVWLVLLSGLLGIGAAFAAAIVDDNDAEPATWPSASTYASPANRPAWDLSPMITTNQNAEWWERR